MLPWNEARAIWERAESIGHLTPYQTWAWVDAWNREVVEPRGESVFALVIEDAGGAAAMALPLATHRMGPARTAVIVGGDHANFKFPVLCGPAVVSWSGAALRDTMRKAMHEAGIDLLAFDNMPKDWQGVANPFADALTQSGPNVGFKASLTPDPEDYFTTHLGNQHRKKLRQKERGLERLAPIRFLRAATEADVDVILAAFFALKAERFAELDVPDVFQEAGIKAFMRRSATQNLAEGRPALVLYALFSGDRVVAIYGGSEHGDRFAASVNAMALDDVRRYSPGDLLLLRVIEDCCRKGLRTFDLGLGGSAYKTNYCPDLEPVFDGIIAASGKGAAIGRLWLARRRLKARLKNHPKVIAWLQHILRMIGR